MWFPVESSGKMDADMTKMDICDAKTPFFCVHNQMCYGMDQYCSKDEDKIQECLPKENAHVWCKENMHNESAFPDPECTQACFHKFNTSDLGLFPQRVGTELSDTNNINKCEPKEASPSVTIIVGCIIAVLAIGLLVLIFLQSRKIKKLKQDLEKAKRSRTQDPEGFKDDSGDFSLNKPAMRQMSKEDPDAPHEDSLEREDEPLVSVRSDGASFQTQSQRSFQNGQQAEAPGAGNPEPNRSESNTSYPVDNDTGYGSSGMYGSDIEQDTSPEPNGDRSDPGPESSTQRQGQAQGHSSSATEDGRNTSFPNPMPSQQNSLGKMVTSQTQYTDAYLS